jgi:hypothetical protein
MARHKDNEEKKRYRTEQSRVLMAKRRAEHHDKVKAYERDWYNQNKQKILARRRHAREMGFLL